MANLSEILLSSESEGHAKSVNIPSVKDIEKPQKAKKSQMQ